MVFHIWFSSHIEEEHWKRPTPIPDSLDNIYSWPPNVNFLGTPIPENQRIDSFRKKIIEDYKIYMEKRRNVYNEWKKENYNK